MSHETETMFKPAKMARKILLMALAESGRTTFCKKLLDEKWRPKREESYPPTIDYERHQRVLLGIQLTFFNLGGQIPFLDRFVGELAEFIFSGTASLVFLVDALHVPEIQVVKYYFDRALDRIQQYSPNALIFLLITKMDKIPLHLKEEVIQSIEDDMLKGLNHYVRVFPTSIFDNSSTRAAEAILHANLQIFPQDLTWTEMCKLLQEFKDEVHLSEEINKNKHEIANIKQEITALKDLVNKIWRYGNWKYLDAPKNEINGSSKTQNDTEPPT